VSRRKGERNQDVRDGRTLNSSLRSLAREFGVHHSTIAEILASTGGDPMRLIHLATETERQVRRRRTVLVERMGMEFRLLAALDDELAIRREDRELGVGP
jgi:hypothetical protein